MPRNFRFAIATLLLAYGSFSHAVQLGTLPSTGIGNFQFGGAKVFGSGKDTYSGSLTMSRSKSGTYQLTSSASGDFVLQLTPQQLYSGSDGLFNLSAQFNSAGVFTGGSMAILGTVAGLIPQNSLLFSANLTGFASDKKLLGFGTNITFCALEIKAYCTSAESVYFALKEKFKFPNGKNTFKTKVASYTTIPAPASLLLLGTGCVGLIGRMRRKLSS